MTKESYFEMCEQLEIEPTDSEIPIEVSDFPDLVQVGLVVYSKLKDTWDPNVGKYMGKDYNIVFDLFELYSVVDTDEKIFLMDIMQIMDNNRIKISSDRVAAELNNQKSKKPH